MYIPPEKTRKDILREKITSGFLGFWVRQFRISYLVVISIIIMGLTAAINIPKESSPAVKLGIISIGTSYPWTNPIDMDALVTDKIYKEIKDIKWIDKITSTSTLGFSSLALTLKTNADTKDVLSDVRSAVSRAQLPVDAKTPTITEIETDTNRAFSIYLYATKPDISKALLFERAIELQDALEKVSGVNKVTLSAEWAGSPIDSNGGSSTSYEVHIIIPEEKLTSLWLSLATISNTLQSYNRDQPIGNYAVGDKKYDFRIEGKSRESFEFLTIPLSLPKGWTITLGEIATIERKYKNESINTLVLWTPSMNSNMKDICKNSLKSISGEGICEKWFSYIGMTVNKADNADIFSASDLAKNVVENTLSKDTFQDFWAVYAIDLADNIRDDYRELAKEAVITLLLVFFAMYLFVGFRDSIFATITLPLAFLSTFLILYYGGYTMNFLTNFSLILSFGIAVDTIIVIVQAASAKIRVWYDPESAIMLALREYAVPIISWVMTTIVVFIPMMTLPGILGKFLAYIPITIFGVLATWLILALTVNSALYLLFVKKSRVYVDNPTALEYATLEEKELLDLEREWKEKIDEWNAPLRIRVIHSMTEWYKRVLRNFLEHKSLRRTSIILPILFLFFGFIVLAPMVGFNLFPWDDNAYTSFTITGPVWQKTEVTAKDLEWIQSHFLGFDEIKYSNISINENIATIGVQLTKRFERKAKEQRDVFTLEKILLERLQVYKEKWYNVVSEVLENGPPGTKAIGLKLSVDNPENLSVLIDVAKDFESYLKTVPGTKNVGRSSRDTPGQFIFSLKKDLIASTGISPAMIYAQMAQNMNGITIGTVEDNGEDMNIILKSSKFEDDVRLEDILSLPISLGTITYSLGDFVESTLSNATASVSRTDGDVEITVDADLEDGFDTVSTQRTFLDFAEKYEFPSGISYKTGGENEENSELIVAILSAFFIALIVIFAILTLQFHSFSQPLVILYSVIMSLPFVMIGLLLTDNTFSLPFGIWFIAFTGIAVNHGIILISAINENLNKWIEGITALVEAGSSRLEPMLLTTVTTALGILPIALRDKFWSWMGFTIIFWVIAASALTLFVVKGIYYEMYLASNQSFTKRLFHKITLWKFRKKERTIKN